jgi:hypothetical protein
MLRNASTSSACTDFLSNFKIIPLVLSLSKELRNRFFNSLLEKTTRSTEIFFLAERAGTRRRRSVVIGIAAIAGHANARRGGHRARTLTRCTPLLP